MTVLFYCPDCGANDYTNDQMVAFQDTHICEMCMGHRIEANETLIKQGQQPIDLTPIKKESTVNNLYPTYAPVPATIERENTESWRHNFSVDTILNGMPCNHNPADGEQWALYAGSKDIVLQYGRALAMWNSDQYKTIATDSDWTILYRADGSIYRMRKLVKGQLVHWQLEHIPGDVVRNNIRNFGKQQTRNIVFKTDYLWRVHAMTKTKGIGIRYMDSRWVVDGRQTQALHRKYNLRSVGGTWDKENKVWIFRLLPKCLVPYLNSRITKYHMLSKVLNESTIVTMRPAKLTEQEVTYWTVDAYRRESWYLSGYDWKQFPQHTNSPITVTEPTCYHCGTKETHNPVDDSGVQLLGYDETGVGNHICESCAAAIAKWENYVPDMWATIDESLSIMGKDLKFEEAQNHPLNNYADLNDQWEQMQSASMMASWDSIADYIHEEIEQEEIDLNELERLLESNS